MGDNGDTHGGRLLTNRGLLGLVLVAVLMILLVLFVADNFVLVEIRLLIFRIHMRLAWALLLALLGGAAIGFLAGRFTR